MLVEEISVLALDVDGVLTDGSVSLGVNGDETKSIALRDLDALSAARRAGLRLALVSGETGPILQAIAERIGVDCLIDQAKDKRAGIARLCERLGTRPECVCFVGDADRDALAFPIVGLALTPRDGSTAARRAAHRVLRASGGRGAVAEAIELLLTARDPVLPQAEQEIRRTLEANLLAHQKHLEESAVELGAIARGLIRALRGGNRVWTCGGPESAASAESFARELVGRFSTEEQPWPAMALTEQVPAPSVPGCNGDVGQGIARKLRALARPGDLVVGVSPDGRCQIVVEVLAAAREIHAIPVAFVGVLGGPVAKQAELVFAAQNPSLARVQEFQLLAWHGLCELAEQALAESKPRFEDRA